MDIPTWILLYLGIATLVALVVGHTTGNDALSPYREDEALDVVVYATLTGLLWPLAGAVELYDLVEHYLEQAKVD